MRSYLRATRGGTIFHVLCIVLLAGLLLISAVIPVAQASTPVDEGTTDAYNYPIKPGSEQWKAFLSHSEMVAACQLPESVLKEMSTMGLVETVLNYPLYDDIYAFNTIQQGFDVMKAQFNGLQELLSRKDAGTVLLTKYRTMNPALDESWSLLDRGQHMATIRNVEVLLAQQTIIDDMTATECRDLITEVLAKGELKEQYSYGFYGEQMTAWIIGRILQSEDYQPFIQLLAIDEALQSFLTKGSFSSENMLQEIFSLAHQFLSEE